MVKALLSGDRNKGTGGDAKVVSIFFFFFLVWEDRNAARGEWESQEGENLEGN